MAKHKRIQRKILVPVLLLGLLVLSWAFQALNAASIQVYTPNQRMNDAVKRRQLRDVTVQFSDEPLQAVRYTAKDAQGVPAVTQYIVQDENSRDVAVLLTVRSNAAPARDEETDLQRLLRAQKEGSWTLEDGALLHRPLEKSDGSYGATATYWRYENSSFITVHTMGFQLYFEQDGQAFYAISDSRLSRRDFDVLLRKLGEQNWAGAR